MHSCRQFCQRRTRSFVGGSPTRWTDTCTQACSRRIRSSSFSANQTILWVALWSDDADHTGKRGNEVAQEYPRKSLPAHVKEFAGIIQAHRDELLGVWRERVRLLPAARDLDTPTLNDHIPHLFDELTQELTAGGTESVLDLQLHDSPKIHGGLRLRAGFDILEVVAEYNILRELLSNLAEEQNIDISGESNRILNRVVDRAVALAVDSFAKEKALEIQQRREEHLSFLIHDLKTPLSAIHAAGRILETSLPGEKRSDRVGSMLDILRRNALRLNALIN